MKYIKEIRCKIAQMPLGIKSSIAFALASFISTGISYLTTPIFTRLLSIDDYGHVNVFLTWQSLFAIPALFSLHYGIFNNGMMDYKDDRDRYSFSLLILSNIITFIVSVFIVSGALLFPGLLQISIQYVFLMVAVFFVQPAYNFWLARQRFEYKYKPALGAAIIIALVAPLISVFSVVIVSNNRVSARLYGLEIPLFVIYFWFYLKLGKNARWSVERKYWKEAILFNLPLLPHYLSTYLLSSSDKLMIAKLVGNYATGYYSVAYAIASLGLIIWTAINGSLIPFTYEKLKKNDYNTLSNVVTKILMVVLMCSVVVILIAPEVLHFLASNSYETCLQVIPVIVGGVFFQTHYSIYANVLFYYRKPKFVMFASISATALNLLTNFIFIKKFGYIAAGYTTLLCYLFQAMLDFIAMKYVVKNSVYNMKAIGIMSLICIVCSLFGNILYENQMVRYSLLIVLIMAIYLGRNVIINTIKKIKQ